MKKTLVQIYTNGQSLEYRTRPLIASSGVNEDIVRFLTDEIWDDLNLSMVCHREGCDETYTAALDENHEAIIPWEVLEKPGAIFIGLCGEDGDGNTVVTSELLQYKVVKGLSTTDIVTDPTARHRGVVKTSWLADKAVTHAKLADGAVGEDNLTEELKEQLGKGATYELTQDGDTITLTGSDGTTSSVTVMGGAPEASSEVIADVLGGMD